MQHPDDLMYNYLYARSLMGRNTCCCHPANDGNCRSSIPTLRRPTVLWRKSTLRQLSTMSQKRRSSANAFSRSVPNPRTHGVWNCSGSVRRRCPTPSPLIDQAERSAEPAWRPRPRCRHGRAGHSGRRMAAAAHPSFRLVQRRLQTPGPARTADEILESVEHPGSLPSARRTAGKSRGIAGRDGAARGVIAQQIGPGLLGCSRPRSPACTKKEIRKTWRTQKLQRDAGVSERASRSAAGPPNSASLTKVATDGQPVRELRGEDCVNRANSTAL